MRSPAWSARLLRDSMFRRILAATDFSPAADAALEEAIRLAAESKAELLIANVCDEIGGIEMGFAPETSHEQWKRAARESARRKLEPLAERGRTRGVAVRTLVLGGSPDQALIEASKREAADLIVMGTRGLRGAERFFLGSVASRILPSARCPVMTVRAPSA